MLLLAVGLERLVRTAAPLCHDEAHAPHPCIRLVLPRKVPAGDRIAEHELLMLLLLLLLQTGADLLVLWK